MPDHRGGLTVECEYRGGGLRDVDRRAGVHDATKSAAAAVDTLRGRLTVLGPLGHASRSIAVADQGRADGVGCRNARCPAGANRRKNLHRQGEQDYGQKVL